MEDVLVIIIQFVLELVVNGLIYLPFDWINWGKNMDLTEPESIKPFCFMWFLIGAGLAAISLLLFQHTLIALRALRMFNLIASPLFSGFVAERLATVRAKFNPHITPRAHFWQAFWFTLGFVIVRFAYISRS